MEINSQVWNTISAEVSNTTSRPFLVKSFRPISGGDINRSFIVTGHDTAYFVKLNDASMLRMFEQEALSLTRLRETGVVAVPMPLAHGTAENASFLVLSCHDIASPGDHHILGRKLAELHRHTGEQYGWDHDNYIGLTLQKNHPGSNWLDFWRNQRLLPQLNLAYDNGYRNGLTDLAHQLIERLPAILADHNPPPSILHGDLWGGNVGFVSQSEPILFDPASYYGDRETDLAMTELFGGFQADFYSGYNEVWPLPDSYQRRKPLYQLYHMLNHVNLFGASYLGSCKRLMNKLIQNSREP